MPERKWDKSFDPEEIEILETAASIAFTALSNNTELKAVEGCRAIVTRHIMSIAGGGEWDPETLAREAIAALRQREQVRRSALSAANREFEGTLRSAHDKL